MIKKPFIVISVLLFSFTLVQCQESISDEDITKELVTEAMVIEQERLCLEKYTIEEIEDNVKALTDSLSVSEVKKLLKKSYIHLLENKSEFVEQFEQHKKSIEDDFLSRTRSYLPDEERFIETENVFEELVNDNHINYRDAIYEGAYFDQFFENNTSFIQSSTIKNKERTIVQNDSYETIFPYYSLNFDSESELKIMNIYYHDGTTNAEEVPVSDDEFPLESIPVDKMKHIDSLQMKVKVMYVSEIDSVHFNINEIGLKKGDFKLLKMDSNYVEYEMPNDYYPYHIGSILEELYFNNEGKALKTDDNSLSMGLETIEEQYVEMLDLRREYYEYGTIAETKEQVTNALKYVGFKFQNDFLKEKRKIRVFLKGNVESFTIYQEKRRDTLTFLTTLKNAHSIQNLYLHKLEDETEFIDKNGKNIISIPSKVQFLYFSKDRSYSDKYFFTDNDSYDIDDRQYYYINQERQGVIKLPYSEINYVIKSIIWASSDDAEGFKLLSGKNNKLLSDKIFNNFTKRYIDDALVFYDDNNDSFLLLDQNNEIITSGTEKVTKITIKKIDD